MERLPWNLGASTSWNPQSLLRPVQGLLYRYFTVTLPLLYLGEERKCSHSDIFTNSFLNLQQHSTDSLISLSFFPSPPRLFPPPFAQRQTATRKQRVCNLQQPTIKMHTNFQLHTHNCITTIKLLHISSLKVHYQAVYKIIFYETHLIFFYGCSLISRASCKEHRIILEILRV
jgi:hypothetical protein